MGKRKVKSVENKKIEYIDANNLHGYSMSQTLLYDEIKFFKSVNIEDILNTLDVSDTEYFFELGLKHPDGMRKNIVRFVLRINLVLNINLMFIW